jgi:hypothetical protein
MRAQALLPWAVMFSTAPSQLSRYERVKAIPAAPWRWMALGAVVAAFVHDRLGARSGAWAIEGHVSSIGPAPSAFVTWTVIQVVLIGYCLAQLFEEQRPVAIHDRLSRLVVVVALLSSVRLTMMVQGNPWITTAVSISIAVASAVAYLRIRHEIVAHRASGWIGLPFSLLLGWTTLIAGASLDAAIRAAGYPSLAAAVTIVVLAAGALYLGLQFRDFVLPAGVAWLLISICASNRLAAPLATGVLLAGSLCAIVGIMIAATRFSRSPQAASPSPSRRSRQT